MRKAAEIKLYDEGNVTFWIEKDRHSVTIIKQEPDTDGDKDARKHTNLRLTLEQADYITEALRDLQKIDHIEEYEELKEEGR